MNYCILRIAKLKSIGEAIKSARHTFREIPTPNADKNRTHLNKTEGAQSSLGLSRALQARLPEKHRRDAVVCIEYLITASPEWWKTAPIKQQNDYIGAAIGWLRARHGEANVVCVNVQLDEKSPHIVAYVVPLTKDGRLSASDFLGSPKLLSEMQTEFAEKIGKPVGLERGVEGSKAEHTTAKQYAAALNKNPALAPPAPPAPSFADRLTGKARQAGERHAAEQAEYAALVQRAANIAQVSQRSRAAQTAAIAKLRKEIQETKRHRLEAARLRKENDELRALEKERERAFDAEKRSFMQTITTLKAQLQEAVKKIECMAARILLLECKLFSKSQNRHLTAGDGDDNAGLKFRL